MKTSKCKTLLKLVISRIKLLRNRGDVQMKQMRRDLASLLRTGQEPAARIRVEHIIREQNLLAAYDILELFCEFIAVRLPVIESQRECPIDLRESIASIIFSGPRCTNLPELLEIRTIFAEKYGKDFVATAAELRPDCGVNRTIIEKLSIQPPSGEVRLKVMKEIAEENSFDWDSSATEAEFMKPTEDLLEGFKQKTEAVKQRIEPTSDSRNLTRKDSIPSPSQEGFKQKTEAVKQRIEPTSDSRNLTRKDSIPSPSQVSKTDSVVQTQEKSNEVEPQCGPVSHQESCRAVMDSQAIMESARAATKAAERAVRVARAAAELAKSSIFSYGEPSNDNPEKGSIATLQADTGNSTLTPSSARTKLDHQSRSSIQGGISNENIPAPKNSSLLQVLDCHTNKANEGKLDKPALTASEQLDEHDDDLITRFEALKANRY